jgi:hypothetical protein
MGHKGGVGWINAICSTYDPFEHTGPFSFSDAQPYFDVLPAYSYSVFLVAHELGHNVGSRHTHYCGWELSPGVFGAIDSCTSVEEDSSSYTCYYGPDIPRIGTIMSYCDFVLGVNLNLGFGPPPSTVMRGRIEYGSCLPASSALIVPVATNSGPYCLGDTIFLNLFNNNRGAVAWSGPDGYTSSDSTPVLLADNMAKRGVYRAIVSNDTCDVSDTTYVEISNAPPISAINYYSGNILQPALTGLTYHYQWYYNNNSISGATSSTYVADTSGQYKVEISNAAGCKTMSLPYSIVVNGLDALESIAGKIYKSPSENDVIVELYEKPCKNQSLFQLCDVTGRIVHTELLDCNYLHIISINNLASGLYFARISQDRKLKLSNKILKN